MSFLVVNKQALLTYYDWRDRGQPNFQNTSLRERLIPLAPLCRPDQNASRPIPIGVTQPIPVMTTRRGVVKLFSILLS